MLHVHTDLTTHISGNRPVVATCGQYALHGLDDEEAAVLRRASRVGVFAVQLSADKQRSIAEELDRTVGEVFKKLEDIRNKL